LIALPTVMFGGFSLLRLLIAGRLNEFQVAYFRAGHAHAGILLVLSLVVLDLVTRTDLSRVGQWAVGRCSWWGRWRSPVGCSSKWVSASPAMVGGERPDRVRGCAAGRRDADHRHCRAYHLTGPAPAGASCQDADRFSSADYFLCSKSE
jgi:hypothetical protein